MFRLAFGCDLPMRYPVSLVYRQAFRVAPISGQIQDLARQSAYSAPSCKRRTIANIPFIRKDHVVSGRGMHTSTHDAGSWD